MRLVVLLICASSLSACQQSVPRVRAGTHVRDNCPQREAGDFYLPVDVSAAPLQYAAEFRKTFNSYLRAAEAPTLSCGDSPTDAYRFTWLPDYRGVIVVTVRNVEGVWSIEAAEFKHPKTGERFAVERKVNRPITSAEMATVIAAVDSAEFWSHAESKIIDFAGGSVWVFEGRQSRSYIAFSRQGAAVNDRLKQLGRRLATLAGFVPELDIG